MLHLPHSCFPVLVLVILTGLGCTRWTTFEFYNASQEEIRVAVHGVTPDVSPGFVMPSEPGQSFASASSEFGDPILFDDTIKIVWLMSGGDVKRELDLKRSDYGIPSKMSGGTVTMTFTGNETWEVKYSH